MSFNIQAIGVLVITVFYPFFNKNLFTNNLHKLNDVENDLDHKETSRPMSKSFVKGKSIENSNSNQGNLNCNSNNSDKKNEINLKGKEFRSRTFVNTSPNYNGIEKNILKNNRKSLESIEKIEETNESSENEHLKNDDESFFEESFKEEEKHIFSDFKSLIFQPVSIKNITFFCF